MSLQTWKEVLSYQIADGSPIANTTTETIIYPNIIIPAGYLNRERLLYFYLSGKYSTTSAPTGIWRVRWNGVSGTVLGLSETITLGTTQTNLNWWMEGFIQARASGSAGVLFLMGTLYVHLTTGAASAYVLGVSGSDAPAQVGSLDLNVDTPLTFSFTWGTASVSNTLTGMQQIVSALQ